MQHSDDINDLKAKHICFDCVGEAYLSDEIKKNGVIEQCFYCTESAECYAIATLAERIEAAFDDHFYRTSDQPDSLQRTMLADKESSYNWDRDGAPICDAIAEAAGLSESAATDIQSLLDDKHGDFESDQMGEETDFSSDSYYEERGSSDEVWQDEWRAFERSLKQEARFFSRVAASHLMSVFGGIDKLKTEGGTLLVLNAGEQSPLNHLYRARVFQSEDKLTEALCRPDLHLGSPPSNLASAGRMNARGISVFYGATEAGVAIAEVRPPVGSRVAVAKFNIMRPLRLLDLTALKQVRDSGSYFDPSLKGRLERVAFLRTLEQRMTRPVMPDDEVFDYLATQAVADFLATENDPLVDGIIFRSAQVKDGRNVVLFHKAAQIEPMTFPDETKISASTGYGTEEGWEVDYSVSERLPPPSPPEAVEDGLFHVQLYAGSSHYQDKDSRQSALRIDPQSVVVHHIEWVEYHDSNYKVDRYRYETHGLKF
ncbi:RES domain-containing protein [Collimonas pratensis]|uniref:RES family NAD+ phosphorylase n=1 Tax=Collimonas pratensis TaxID=279113 RepID=UPI00143DAE0D|nr:RES family NAD+ phosphorylase [Collimonas pratensis]NKI68072.1 RES domain-containing protein [Collimonas pratensis]